MLNSNIDVKTICEITLLFDDMNDFIDDEISKEDKISTVLNICKKYNKKGGGVDLLTFAEEQIIKKYVKEEYKEMMLSTNKIFKDNIKENKIDNDYAIQNVILKERIRKLDYIKLIGFEKYFKEWLYEEYDNIYDSENDILLKIKEVINFYRGIGKVEVCIEINLTETMSYQEDLLVDISLENNDVIVEYLKVL